MGHWLKAYNGILSSQDLSSDDGKSEPSDAIQQFQEAELNIMNGVTLGLCYTKMTLTVMVVTNQSW